MRRVSRRTFVGLVPAIVPAAIVPGVAAGGPRPVAAGGPRPAAASPAAAAQATEGAVPEVFPQQPDELVRAVVGASHSDLDRVRELVMERPALAAASWDWGFGDWETALGAAAHTGRREIAEFLLAHGARPTIFSAAMLGQLGVVRAFVEASPGVQRTPGPHGIPLMAHARAGGDAAAPVVAYLAEVGGADERPPTFSDETAARVYLGTYALAGSDRHVLVAFRRNRLQLGTDDGNGRNWHAVDEPHAFHPAGAPDVRILFTVDDGRATQVSIRDGSLTLVATRVAD